MNCSEVRHTLYPTPDKSLVTIETAQALAHLRECDSCQAHFEAQTEWARILHEKLPCELAPASLQARIANLAERRQSSRFYWPHTRPARTAVAALALLVVGFLAWWTYRIPSQRFFEELCEDHAKYLSAESQLQSNDPAAIEAWFLGQAGFGVRVPKLENTELLGSRLCFLKRRKAALIFYRRQGRPVSLFELSESDVSLSALNRMVIDGSPIWHKSLNGYSLVAFENRGVVSMLVSDLRESELLALALAARRG